MSILRRALPLLGLIIPCFAFVIRLPYEFDTITVRVLLFLLGFSVWWILFRPGLRTVDKDRIEILEDLFGNIEFHHAKDNYVFVPGYHAFEATLPSFPIKHEFAIESIDTRTPGLQRIDRITMRIKYCISDARACFTQVMQSMERVKELEEHRKYKRSDIQLWKQVLNEQLAEAVDDALREGVWRWARSLASKPRLALEVPFPLPLNTEFDPYALSLNREHLAEEIIEQVQYATTDWGIEIEDLAFENFVIDAEIIKRKTRNRDRELDEANHQALMEAAAIKIKGEAEAEIRARTVARVIEVLVNQRGITLTNEVLYNVVRAAMYSDGEMIWSGVVDRGSSNGATAKTA